MIEDDAAAGCAGRTATVMVYWAAEMSETNGELAVDRVLHGNGI